MVKCFICSKEVYTTEEVKAVGKVFHQTCFKCFSCKATLAVGGVLEHEGAVYCTTCHGKLFSGPKQASYETEASTSALDSDLKAKRDAKLDPSNEAAARAFLESTLGTTIEGDLGDALHDGVILCNLANALRPGLITGHKPGSASFVQMENISKFLKSLAAFGFRTSDTFMTVDLYEKKNMVAVVDTLLLLKRKVAK